MFDYGTAHALLSYPSPRLVEVSLWLRADLPRSFRYTAQADGSSGQQDQVWNRRGKPIS